MNNNINENNIDYINNISNTTNIDNFNLENEKNIDNLKFENIDNFNLLLIKPCDISNLDWNLSNYIDNILDLNIYENINSNSSNFIKLLSDNLELSKYNENKNLELTTQIIAEMVDYIYEIIYINNLSELHDIYNGVASLLNTNETKLYGNVILIKTFMSSTSNSMLIQNCYKSDIQLILNLRVNTNIVIYDGEWENKIVNGDISTFASSFFDDKYYKLEVSFLLHNINIWYEICDGCSTILCGKLLDKPIYKCLWFTMISNEYRGNLTLDEVNKIIKISLKLDYPYHPNVEWLKEEKDEYGRKIIKNKYKILDYVYNLI